MDPAALPGVVQLCLCGALPALSNSNCISSFFWFYVLGAGWDPTDRLLLLTVKIPKVHHNIRSSCTQQVSHVRLPLQEAETHAERLQRLRKIAAPADLSGLSASQKRKVMRKLKAEQRRKAVLHRPGKRQRAELKAEVFKTAADDSAEKSAPSKKSRKSQDARGKQNQDTRGKKKAGISKKKASISKMSRKSKV